jgi:acyl-CoA thioesterase YciA
MELISTHPVLKTDLGFSGNLYGGQLLYWVDGAVAAYAMQVCDTNKMVTVSIDKCIFKKPVKQGQLIKIYADVKDIGNTSITFHIEARQHNVYTGKQHTALSTHIKFVRVDDEGNSIPISDKVKAKVLDSIKNTTALTK